MGPVGSWEEPRLSLRQGRGEQGFQEPEGSGEGTYRDGGREEGL